MNLKVTDTYVTEQGTRDTTVYRQSDLRQINVCELHVLGTDKYCENIPF